MSARMLPNPRNLTIRANGRVYAGTANVPYPGIPDQDAAVLSANGWLTLEPVASEYVQLTQAQYDALTPPVSGVLYLIVG